MPTASLAPLPFHVALRDTLRDLEPGLFRWFSSDGYSKKYLDGVRLELLRSTYRMPRDAHAKLYAIADEVKDAFGIDAPLTLYQAQEDGALNAALLFVPREVHVVLRGPLAEMLSEAELRALFGHELAHHKLWTEEGGEYLVTSSVIEHMACGAAPAASHVQSALRFRRWTEIYADRGSLAACDDVAAAVACLVKVSTGLREVSAEAYVAQAREVLGTSAAASEGMTHPEPFIRAAALEAWRAGGDLAQVTKAIDGELRVDALDLVQQRELTRTTRALLGALLAPAWMQTESTLAHARRFFPDFAPGGALPSLEGELHDSLAEYLAYVLLDFAVADPDLEDEALARAVHVASALGVRGALQKLAKKELKITAAAFGDLERRGRDLEERGDAVAAEAP